MEKLSYPTDVYFRIVKAEATGELRVDLYKPLEDGHGLHHVMPDGFFFLRELKGVKEADKWDEEKILARPISDLVKKINQVLKDKK
ncbi:MAG: hypothetical protein QW404_02840 [Candidatus Nanoarchaeia archaeon]